MATERDTRTGAELLNATARGRDPMSVSADVRQEAGAASPTLGLVRDARHRYSWNGGPWYPSVTTVLAIKDKPALVGWAKRETAACAVRNLEVLTRMVQSGGPQAAVDWLKKIPDFQRDTAADLGTAVHTMAESLGRGELLAVNEALRPYLAAYRRDFLEAFRSSEHRDCGRE